MKSLKLLKAWYARTTFVQGTQYDAAQHYSRLHYWLGVPVIVLSTVVGTSVFASIQKQPALWVQLLAGVASVLAAVLAGLQTFLGLQDRAEKHRVAGAKYGAVGREIEALMSASAEVSDDTLSQLRERLDRLALEAPHVPAFIVAREDLDEESDHFSNI